MRSLKLLPIFILVCCATHAAGQSPAAAERKALDRGQLAGTSYKNDFFGLTLSIPADWVVITGDRQSAIVDESKKIAAAQTDAKKRSQVTDSIERSTILLSLTKLPAGSPGNAAFMLVAERIPSPSIRTGADVLRSIQSLGEGTNFSVEFLGDIQTGQIGGAEFAHVKIKNTSPHGVFMQKTYVTTKNGYGLQFFFTYLNETDLPAFEAMMKSVTVK